MRPCDILTARSFRLHIWMNARNLKKIITLPLFVRLFLSETGHQQIKSFWVFIFPGASPHEEPQLARLISSFIIKPVKKEQSSPPVMLLWWCGICYLFALKGVGSATVIPPSFSPSYFLKVHYHQQRCAAGVNLAPSQEAPGRTQWTSCVDHSRRGDALLRRGL